MVLIKKSPITLFVELKSFVITSIMEQSVPLLISLVCSNMRNPKNAKVALNAISIFVNINMSEKIVIWKTNIIDKMGLSCTTQSRNRGKCVFHFSSIQKESRIFTAG